MNQQNKTEGLEINPCICRQLIFDKGNKTIQWGIVFSTNGARRTVYLHAEK